MNPSLLSPIGTTHKSIKETQGANFFKYDEANNRWYRWSTKMQAWKLFSMTDAYLLWINSNTMKISPPLRD